MTVRPWTLYLWNGAAQPNMYWIDGDEVRRASLGAWSREGTFSTEERATAAGIRAVRRCPDVLVGFATAHRDSPHIRAVTVTGDVDRELRLLIPRIRFVVDPTPIDLTAGGGGA